MEMMQVPELFETTTIEKWYSEDTHQTENSVRQQKGRNTGYLHFAGGCAKKIGKKYKKNRKAGPP